MIQTMDNPYRVNTQAHAVFANMTPSKAAASRKDLIGQYQACQRLSGDWLNQGMNARSQFELECDVIAEIFKQRFGQDIKLAALQTND